VTTTCSRRRGRSIAAVTERQLWAASAGFCEKPGCLRYLFQETDTGKVVTLGQVAHVVSAGGDGPRSNLTAGEHFLTSFDNLIVLCLLCHHIVDDSEEDYPVGVLTRWKDERKQRIRAALRVQRYDTRAAARDELSRVLQHNHAIFVNYGPHSAAADDPFSDAVDTWRREAIERIVPNNRRIVELLDVNRHLLRPEEAQVVAQYRVHADAFEARHLFGVITASAPQYPPATDHLLED